MPANPDDILAALETHERTFAARRTAEPRTLRRLLDSIHSDPMLRHWVTLESRALAPLVIRQGKHWLIHVLLSVPKSAKETFHMPWGCVVWQWPDASVVRLEKLADLGGLRTQSLTSRHLASATDIERIEAALASGQTPPAPPAEVRAIFNDLGTLFPAWNLPRETEPSGDGSAPPRPVEPSAPRQGPLPQGTAEPLRRLEKLLDAPLFNTEREGVARLRASLRRQGFGVVVVGEIGRGKTSLINRLLGRELIAARAAMGPSLPPVRICAGAHDELLVGEPGGTAKAIPLSAESWNAAATRKAFVEVRATGVPLLDAGLQFIEASAEGPHVAQALASCDAALVTVSALAALSLSEMTIIEQHILARKVPRVAVVLTRLDQLDPGETPRLVEFVRGRLEPWRGQVLIGTSTVRAQLPETVALDFAGPDELADLLKQWAKDSEHTALLQRQAHAALVDIAERALFKVRAQREAASLATEERQAAIARAREQIERAEFEWKDLRLSVERRALEAGDTLRTHLLDQQEELTERLRYELRNRPDPKTWWEQDLPFRLRQEMSRLGQQLEVAVRARIESDCGWLAESVRRISGRRSSFSAGGDVAWRDLPGETPSREIADVRHKRMLLRLGVGGIALLGYLVAGPLGMAASVGGGFLADRIVGKELAGQKTDLSAALGRLVEEHLLQAATLMRSRLTAVYQRLSAQLEGEEKQWLAARLSSLESTAVSEGAPGSDPAAELAAFCESLR